MLDVIMLIITSNREIKMMTKKYRLVIPRKIDKGDGWLVEALSEEGEIFTEYNMPDPEGYKAVKGKGNHSGWYEIPVEWLKEIKDGPVSAEQVVKDWLDKPDQWVKNKQMTVWRDDLLSLVLMAQGNERKRVQPVIRAMEDLSTMLNVPEWIMIKAIEALKQLKEQENA
jgi:hypothetical protein